MVGSRYIDIVLQVGAKSRRKSSDSLCMMIQKQKLYGVLSPFQRCHLYPLQHLVNTLFNLAAVGVRIR